MNVLLFVAEACRRYFSPSDIPEMLSTFLPLVTQDVIASSPDCEHILIRVFVLYQNILTIMPVMTAFLPPSHTHLYLPMFFKLWEAFNSSIIDERLLELCGELAEEHIAGEYGDSGKEGGAEFKDVGIWSEAEWTILAGKALGAMSELSPYSIPLCWYTCSTNLRRTSGFCPGKKN